MTVYKTDEKPQGFEDWTAWRHANGGSGNENRYRTNVLFRGVHTDGVRTFAEYFGAYWLLDLICSHQPAILRKLRTLGERDFQIWHLKHNKGRSWTISAWTDSPHSEHSVRLASQIVSHSDLDAQVSGTKFYSIDGTIMLPEEY